MSTNNILTSFITTLTFAMSRLFFKRLAELPPPHGSSGMTASPPISGGRHSSAHGVKLPKKLTTIFRSFVRCVHQNREQKTNSTPKNAILREMPGGRSNLAERFLMMAHGPRPTSKTGNAKLALGASPPQSSRCRTSAPCSFRARRAASFHQNLTE